ncbi:hypothetical protein MXD62_32315 [Frankia sp. Mgl5]|uniref:hypothetical protein n=1 Tax=Frankia sp. Mgl5 TaxID=2933793 RepID=UPI0020109709|nr:hypothetical protein [Frankia sp. Mgl5]MCK9931768.1 hypothetical protein [Frankia sp. Mgl5]
MIGRLFPDEPGDDDTTADWSPPPGDPADGIGAAGWLDLPEYPELGSDDVLTPDLDRALDAVLASAQLDPLPDSTWEHLLAAAYTSPEPDGLEPLPSDAALEEPFSAGLPEILQDPFAAQDPTDNEPDPFDDDGSYGGLDDLFPPV